MHRPPAVPARGVPLDHRRRPAGAARPRSTCRRRPTSPTTSAPLLGVRASTTGAGSRRSPSTTSTPSGPGRRSTSCATATEAAGLHARAPAHPLPRVRPRPRALARPGHALPGARRLRRRGPRPRPPLVLGGRRAPPRLLGRAGPRTRPWRPALRGRRWPGAGGRRWARCSPGWLGQEVGEDEIVTLFSRPRPRGAGRGRGGRPAPRRGGRRRGHLRRQPQHQLHQRLHLQVPVLRLLQGPALAQPAGRALPARARARSPTGCARPRPRAPPRSACRAASTPSSTATTTST